MQGKKVKIGEIEFVNLPTYIGYFGCGVDDPCKLLQALIRKNS